MGRQGGQHTLQPSGYASPTRPAGLLSFPHLLTSWERRHLARLFPFSPECGHLGRLRAGSPHSQRDNPPRPSGHPSREGMIAYSRTCRVTLRPPDLRACPPSSIFLLPGSAGILPACSFSPRSAAILAACGLEARTPRGITHPALRATLPRGNDCLLPGLVGLRFAHPTCGLALFPPSSYFLGARASCPPVPFLPGVRPSWPLAGWKPTLPAG